MIAYLPHNSSGVRRKFMMKANVAALVSRLPKTLVGGWKEEPPYLVANRLVPAVIFDYKAVVSC